MSYINTRNALTTQLLATSVTGVDGDDIAYENNEFDPSNKSLWLRASFLPASSLSTGKTLASSDEQRGIFQVSVFCAINNGSYDNIVLNAIDEILAGFRDTTSVSYLDQNVSIMESTVTSGSENEAWFKRDISINYLTFSKRV